MNDQKVIDDVLDGRRSVESITDKPLRTLASRAWQDQARRREADANLARLQADVAIVPLVAKVDDPAAAVALLDGEHQWEVFDGYLYVTGATNAEVADALIATRRRLVG
jgi:hypothetical protein